jgi:hypothetical protein
VREVRAIIWPEVQRFAAAEVNDQDQCAAGQGSRPAGSTAFGVARADKKAAPGFRRTPQI